METKEKKKHVIPEGERRKVSKKVKLVILAVFAVGLIGIILFKLPMNRTYTATLMRGEPGEVQMYGDSVEVTVDVRVQRYFFSYPMYSGTITVNGDVYDTSITDQVSAKVPNTMGAFEATDTFNLVSQELIENYLVTRCAVYVEKGELLSVTLWDDAATYAGQYIVSGLLPSGN